MCSDDDMGERLMTNELRLLVCTNRPGTRTHQHFAFDRYRGDLLTCERVPGRPVERQLIDKVQIVTGQSCSRLGS